VRAIGERAAEDAVERIRSAGIDYGVDLVPDRPAPSLVEVARAKGASMIVVGTHGQDPIAGAIFGSVPHQLLHISPVPVLVVPAGSS
jgi:nucleotide-binding universal stress UspA family protein